MMEAVVIVVTMTLAGMVSYFVLRHGVRWRVIMLLPATTLLLAGILTTGLNRSLSTWSVIFWVAIALLFYSGMLLYGWLIRPVFERHNVSW